jgi:hypothetical protein
VPQQVRPRPEEATNGSRECAPDDRLRGRLEGWAAIPIFDSGYRTYFRFRRHGKIVAARRSNSGAADSDLISARQSMRGGFFPETKLASRVWSLWLKTKGIARIPGRQAGPTNAADPGGCSLACFHARITAAMCCLSAAGDAIVFCVNGRRCDREKRECEQAGSRGGKRLRGWFHLFFFLFVQARRRQQQTILNCRIALMLTIMDVSTEPRSAIAAIRIAAIPNPPAA